MSRRGGRARRYGLPARESYEARNLEYRLRSRPGELLDYTLVLGAPPRPLLAGCSECDWRQHCGYRVQRRRVVGVGTNQVRDLGLEKPTRRDQELLTILKMVVDQHQFETGHRAWGWGLEGLKI